MNVGPNEVCPGRAILILCDLRDPQTAGFVRRMSAAFRGHTELIGFGTHHVVLALLPGVPTELYA